MVVIEIVLFNRIASGQEAYAFVVSEKKAVKQYQRT